MRLIDADALIKELEKVYEYHMAEVKYANEHPEKYTSKFIPATAGRIDGIADAEIVIADAPTIETDGDLISRQDAIDAIKKAYFDKDIQSAKDDPCIVDAMTDWTIRQIKSLLSAPNTNQHVGKETHDICTETHGVCSDLISRQEAIEYFFRPYSNEELYSNVDIEEALKAIPSADAVEVVLCKDCRHRDNHCGMGEHRWCIIKNGSTAPDDFCSYGERREP